MRDKSSNYFDVRAAIIFIVAHFLSALVYLIVVSNDLIWQSGFTLHMLQAFIYLAVMSVNIGFGLKVMSFITSIFYMLIAVNWLLFQREIEVQMQTYFYNYFENIITAINLIVVYLLGKNGAIYIFNMLFVRCFCFNRIQLFFRSCNYNNIYSINLPIRNKDIKSKEIIK